MSADLSGVVLLDKPAGMTSQQAVSRVKRALGVRKAGHGGTLDPDATGLLVIGVGRATRLLGYVLGHDKIYSATIRLGVGTVTDDAAGEPLGEVRDASRLDLATVSQAMARLTGEIQQVPSAVSAIKVDGRRAYAMVRRGEAVELASRAVTVRRFDLRQAVVSAPWLDLEVEVECSSGTYIRALARDLGRDLGVGGHLTRLRRQWIAGFPPDRMVGLEAVGRPDVASLISLTEAAGWLFDSVTVPDSMVADITQGRPIPVSLTGTTDHPTAILGRVRPQSGSAEPVVVGLYRADPDHGGRAVPVAVFISGGDGDGIVTVSDSSAMALSDQSRPTSPPGGIGDEQDPSAHDQTRRGQ